MTRSKIRWGGELVVVLVMALSITVQSVYIHNILYCNFVLCRPMLIDFVHQPGEHNGPDELVMNVEVASMYNPVNTSLRKDIHPEFVYEQANDLCRVLPHISMLNSIIFEYVIAAAVCSFG
jgi:hypothetical protein